MTTHLEKEMEVNGLVADELSVKTQMTLLKSTTVELNSSPKANH